MSRGTVIFVHIGKTAGTTLSSIARRHYLSRAVFTVDSGAPASPVEQLAALSPERRAQLALVLGHGQFGLHRELPDACTYITILRDPVARAVSAFGHVLRTPSHRLHSLVVESNMTLMDYATGGLTEESDNWQTRCLAGDPQPPLGTCGPELLERAKRNIEEHFAVVGISERFDETLVLLRRRLGWRRIYYVPLNTAGGAAQMTLNARQRECILDCNSLDRDLYHYAAQRLQSELGHAGDVARDVRRLRAANGMYAQVRHGRAGLATIAARSRATVTRGSGAE
jgi:hypothetical protein